MDASALSSRLIGEIFVEKGLVTAEQLRLALEEQDASGERLGEILVRRFDVARLDLASVLAEQWAEYERLGAQEERDDHPDARDLAAVSGEWPPPPAAGMPASARRPIGEIFLERGFVSDQQLQEALAEQERTGLKLGEILVASGRLSRLELASALADQWAGFQKLRPPTEISPQREQVMPAPDVSEPQPPDGGQRLAAAVEALEAQVAELAESSGGWKPKLEQVAELLRARIEQLEHALSRQDAAAAVDALREETAAISARLDAAPAPSGDWRPELAEVAENLRVRLERVEQRLVAAASGNELTVVREALEALSGRIDTLPPPADGWEDALAGLAARVDGLASALEDEAASRAEALAVRLSSLDEGVRGLADRSEQARGELESLAARVDAVPAPSEEWREAVADLVVRLDAVPAPSEEWREAVEALALRIDEIPPPSEEWRVELGDVAENLRLRLERLQAGLTDVVPSGTVEELRAQLEALAARVDALPPPSEEWREALAALSGRLDEIPPPSEEWREAFADLTRRMDEIPPPSEEWRVELGEVSASLRVRLQRLEEGLADAVPGGAVDALEAQLEALAARLDAMPAPSDEWRDALAGLTRRIDEIPPPSEEWREALAEVARRVDEIPASSHEWQEAVADLSRRIDAIPTPSEEWRVELGEVAANLRIRLQRVEEGLSETAAPGLVHEVRSELAARLDVLESRLRPVDEIVERVGEAERRLDAVADAAAGLAPRLDGLAESQARLEASLAEESARTDGLAPHARIDELEASLAGRIEAIEQSAAVARDALGAVVGENATAIEEMRAQLESAAAETREQGAGRRAEVAALYARVDAVEASLAHAGSWPVALEPLQARLDAVDARVGEVATSKGDVRRAELAELRAALDDALERSRESVAGRDDLDRVRGELEALAGRVEQGYARDEAAAGAIEQAVRDGLAELGKRLAASESAYLESGRLLRRSLEGLGAVIAETDASARDDGPPQAETSFLAFAPTAEGYRLLECEGPVPELGQALEVPGAEGLLRVVRVARSPLPFDRRACAYAERVA